MTDRPALHENLSVDTPDVVETVSGVRAVFDSGRTRPMAWRHAQLDGLLRLPPDHVSFVARPSSILEKTSEYVVGKQIGT